MGQGSQTALAQMLADEMDADWALVSVLEAPAHEAFANADVIKGFAGDLGVPDMLMSGINFIAGPAARLAGIQITGGHVFHDASSRKVPYGALIEAASLLTPPENPKLKTPDQFKIMGKSVPRLDVPEKVNGTVMYGIDTRTNGMKYAAIRHSPVFGGQIDSLDESSIAGRR